jgi:ribosomal protein L7/L12
MKNESRQLLEKILTSKTRGEVKAYVEAILLIENTPASPPATTEIPVCKVSVILTARNGEYYPSIKVIKILREHLFLSLKESKDFMESGYTWLLPYKKAHALVADLRNVGANAWIL